MKLSNFTAKFTGMKSKAVRVLAAATLAGAVLAAAVPAAEAQEHVVVRFGGPRYFAPAPPVRFYGGPVYAPGFYRADRRYEFLRYRHEEFRRDGYRGWRR